LVLTVELDEFDLIGDLDVRTLFEVGREVCASCGSLRRTVSAPPTVGRPAITKPETRNQKPQKPQTVGST